MKIRLGFVSNSSSSSFLVIEHFDIKQNHIKELIKDLDIVDNVLVINEVNGFHFGWGPEDLISLDNKIAWCYLQGSESNVEVLTKVLKETLHVDNVIYNITDEKSYIDHQSYDNSIYDNESKLKAFLFHPYNYIHLDNDNH